MAKIILYLLTLAVISGLSASAYAQPNDLCKDKSAGYSSLDKSVTDYLKDERYNSDKPEKQGFSIIGLFKSKAFAAPQNADEDRKKLRDEWKEFLGLDVFYPYFKADEVEQYVSKKTSVKVFNLNGKPEFDRSSKGVKYIFKRKF